MILLLFVFVLSIDIFFIGGSFFGMVKFFIIIFHTSRYLRLVLLCGHVNVMFEVNDTKYIMFLKNSFGSQPGV